MPRRLQRTLLGLFVTLSAALGPVALQARAATTRYVATSGADTGACTSQNAPCKTIGFALSAATAGDTISVAAGTYTEHGLTLGRAVTITGAGAGTTIVDGQLQSSVVIVQSGVSATLSGLTLQHGRTTGWGGGIDNQGGTLTLTNATISGSTAGYQNLIGGGNGGGLHNGGTATLSNVTFSGNTDNNGWGGGIENTGMLTLTSVNFTGNTAGQGGGIYNDAGTMMVTGSTFTQNVAGYGGGIANFGGSATLNSVTLSGNSAADADDGGGIYHEDSATATGMLSLTDVTFSGNSAGQGGGLYAGGRGAMTVTNVLFTDNSGYAGAGMYSGGAGTYANSGTLTLTNVSFTGNLADWGGGGIDNVGVKPLTLNGVSITNNVAREYGGGIWNQGNTATFSNVVLSGNAATFGGGLYNTFNPVTLTNATVSGNSGTDFGGTSFGGGIDNGGTLTLTNATVSGNSAGTIPADGIPTGGYGGGIYNTGTLTLTQVTLSTNASTVSDLGPGTVVVGDANGIDNSGMLKLQSSVVAASPCGTPVTSLGANVSDDASCFPPGGSDLLTNPRLGPLADNNGPSVGAPGATDVLQTQALLLGSPALQHVAIGDCPPPATDERGVPRPAVHGASCDTGAFEAAIGTGTIIDAPALSAIADGSEVALFGRSPTGELWMKETSGGKFTADWLRLTASGVAARPKAVAAGGNLFVFFRAVNNELHYFERVGGAWGKEQSLGGVIAGSPAAAVDGNGTVIVGVLNGAGNVFVNVLPSGGPWSGYQSLYGVLSGRLDLVNDNGDVYLFGINGGGLLWYRQWTHSAVTWDDWTSLDGVLSSAPTAAVLGSTLTVFGINPAGVLFYRAKSGGTFDQWQSLDGVLSGDPAAAATATKLLAFGVNPAGVLFDQRQSSGSWSGWDPLDGVLVTGPEAATAGTQTYVFAINAAGNTWYRGWDGTTFGTWQNLGGILATESLPGQQPPTSQSRATLRH